MRNSFCIFQDYSLNGGTSMDIVIIYRYSRVSGMEFGGIGHVFIAFRKYWLIRGFF